MTGNLLSRVNKQLRKLVQRRRGKRGGMTQCRDRIPGLETLEPREMMSTVPPVPDAD